MRSDGSGLPVPVPLIGRSTDGRFATSVDVIVLLCFSWLFVPELNLISELLSKDVREDAELMRLLTLVCFVDCQDRRFLDVDGLLSTSDG